MAQNLVIYVQGGKVRRVIADFEAGMNCLIVYADVPKADLGQPWVREIEWPARNRQKALTEGIVVEHSRAEVRAVVRANEASGVQVRELLRNADSTAPAVSDHDDGTRTVKVYRWKQRDAIGEQEHASARFGTLAAIAGLERCTPLLETEEEVDARRVDADGFLMEGR